MDSKDKEVRFDIYCRYCKFCWSDGIHDPCDECLGEPSNKDTHTPAYFQKEKPIINFLLPDDKSYTRDINKAKYWEDWPTEKGLKECFTLDTEKNEYFEKPYTS